MIDKHDLIYFINNSTDKYYIPYVTNDEFKNINIKELFISENTFFKNLFAKCCTPLKPTQRFIVYEKFIKYQDNTYIPILNMIALSTDQVITIILTDYFIEYHIESKNTNQYFAIQITTYGNTSILQSEYIHIIRSLKELGYNTYPKYSNDTKDYYIYDKTIIESMVNKYRESYDLYFLHCIRKYYVIKRNIMEYFNLKSNNVIQTKITIQEVQNCLFYVLNSTILFNNQNLNFKKYIYINNETLYWMNDSHEIYATILLKNDVKIMFVNLRLLKEETNNNKELQQILIKHYWIDNTLFKEMKENVNYSKFIINNKKTDYIINISQEDKEEALVFKSK